MSIPSTYSRYIFSERPTGDITPTTFKKETRSSAEDLEPAANQAVVRQTWMSLDPAMRAWLNDTKRSYTAPVKLGSVMRSGGLGVVVKTGEGSTLSVGDEVYGTIGWSEFAVMNDKDLTKLIVPKGAEVLDYLGVLGSAGLTAYFGLFDVGNLKAGETLVVTGAAGSVGSIVCQIGKLKGAKVIAVAGGPEKCAWLKNELGVDVALDYKSSSFHDDFKKNAGFVDVFFDNVGGDILNFIMTRMNLKGRIVLCGAISDYNGKPTGLTSYMSLIAQRARIEGFVVFDYAAQFPAAIRELSEWIGNGSIKRKFHIVEGLDSAPAALPMLYKGGNTGKLVVKIGNHENASKL